MHSFEIFPPKTNLTIDVDQLVSELVQYNPEFISVTYGANKSVANRDTLTISQTIQDKYKTKSVHHLTGVHFGQSELYDYLGQLKAANITNILALRGDIPEGVTPKYKYAYQLIEDIKAYDDSFYIYASAYPEGHAEQFTSAENIAHVQAKIKAGAQELITQLFFDNNKFYNLLKKVNVPLHPGIMPLTNTSQISKMIYMCGASLPAKLVKTIYKYQNDPKSFEQAALNYAIEQIQDLKKNGVDNLHIYTMNKPQIAHELYPYL